MSQDMTSFIVRFVREPSEDEQTRWRGIINHVQSNAKRNFTQFTEAVQFIQEQMGKEVVQEILSLKPETLLNGNTQLWSEFSRFQEYMFQAWLDALNSPSSGQPAMTDILRAWQLPDRTQQEAVISALEKLNLRLEKLTRQVQNLESSAVSPPAAV